MNVSRISLPLWLIICLVGLGQLSETIYTVSLPIIQSYMHTTPHVVEWTLTIYLFGFAFGSLFWGMLSDKYGRRSCMAVGLVVYIVGCLFCFSSTTITLFMIGRLVQSFGGAVSVVVSQSMIRDTYVGKELSRVISIVGSSLSLFPAVGPLIGSLIIKYYEWPIIFVVLSIVGCLFLILMLLKLPETHSKERRIERVIILPIAKRMVKDWNVIIACVLVSLMGGIGFSYYAEAPFYVQKLLGIPATKYGMTITVIMVGFFIGGLISGKLSSKFESKIILKYATSLNLAVGTILFSGIAVLSHFDAHNHTILFFLLACMMAISCIQCIVVSQSLSIALINYRDALGTAASLLNFTNYMVISLCTFIMGGLHNDSLFTMPLYFLVLLVIMFVMFRVYVANSEKTIQIVT